MPEIQSPALAFDRDRATQKFPVSKYDAMSVWDLYRVLNSLVSVKNTFDLMCCAETDPESPVFDWAEEREAGVGDEIHAISINLMNRLDLSRDELDMRDMAFARIDGFVPAAMWEDGRMLRMRSALQLKKAGA